MGFAFLKKKKLLKAKAFIFQALLQSLEIKQKSNFLQNVLIGTFPYVTPNEFVQQTDLEGKKKKEERCLRSHKPLIFVLLKFNKVLLIMNAARKMGEQQWNGLEIPH